MLVRVVLAFVSCPTRVSLFRQITILDNVLLCKAIHPDKSCKGNSLTSAAFLFRQIQSSILSVDPQASEHPADWRIVVEEYLKMFGSTSFRTQGLFYLAEINGIIQFKCWEMFGSPPTTLHPSTARSLLSVKSAGDRQETKKVVLQYVQNNTKGMIHWPEKKRGSGLSDDCFDMADAYILARASYVQNLIDEVNRKLVADKDHWAQSPFFCEYLKANLVHFIRKYGTAMEYRSFETIPKELADVELFEFANF